MPRLVVQSGPNKGSEFELTGAAIMGRGDGVDVPVKDGKASREHCRVFEQGGAWVVVDLNSRNGITVNGVKTTRKNLRGGDKIAIGQTVVAFMADPGGAAPKKQAAPSQARAAASKKEAAFAAARSEQRGGSGGGGGGSADAGIQVSDNVLQFNKIDASKASLFDLDLTQNTIGMQVVIWVTAFVLLGAVVWGIASLMT